MIIAKMHTTTGPDGGNVADVSHFVVFCDISSRKHWPRSSVDTLNSTRS